VRLEIPPPAAGENPAFAEYRRIPNSDFEGLAIDPRNPDSFFGVTEDKIPWLVDIHLEWAPGSDPNSQRNPRANPCARIVELTPIEFPPDLAPWRDDPNFRWEGCAVSDDGETLYLAFERAKDDLPRIYELPVKSARSGKAVAPKEVPFPFAAVAPRADKRQALLNLNDLQYLSSHGRPTLVALARDQERILLLDLKKGEVSRVVDLDLRDPAGNSIEWVSPEGLAIDAATDRLWIVNDPDSVRGNYRARGDAAASGEFADFSPLLFQFKLSEVLGRSS
jgi:uncharacterized protein YjiK